MFLLDRYTISLSASLAPMPGSRRGARQGPVVAVAGRGDPAGEEEVVGAGREIAGIAAALRGREVIAIAGEEATERAVRRLAAGAAILHLAAHARANELEPEYAGIALMPSGDDDGILHAYEVREIGLDGAIVVLSACETGSGRLAGGEGMLSLNRAFLQAGAFAVIGTLWPVGAPTAGLMSRFYESIASDQTPNAALRNAKLALRQGLHSDPFYWAPFTLVTRAP